MKTYIVVDISSPIPYLGKFWFSSYGPKCCQPMKLQDFLNCDISRKKGMMKSIFDMQINIRSFRNMTLSFWVYIASLAQSAQNKFTISFKHLKK